MSERDDPLAGPEEEREPSWRERVWMAVRTPVARVLFGVALIGLVAFLYLSEVSGVTTANDRLRALQAEQVRIARQDALLRQQLGEATSPAYIDARARELGLAPAPAGTTQILAVQVATAAGGQS